MNFCRDLRGPSLAGIDPVPLLNVVLLTAVFFLFVFMFAGPASLNVRLPRAVTSDMVHDPGLTVMVTSENILYVNGRVTTLLELKKILSLAKGPSRSVLIKADRRASVGCLVDIWNLGREAGIERINVASDQEE